MKKLYPYTEEQLAKYSINTLNAIYTRFTKVENTKYLMAYWIEQVVPHCHLAMSCDIYTKKEMKEKYLMFERLINDKKLELFLKYVK